MKNEAIWAKGLIVLFKLLINSGSKYINAIKKQNYLYLYIFLTNLISNIYWKHIIISKERKNEINILQFNKFCYTYLIKTSIKFTD